MDGRIMKFWEAMEALANGAYVRKTTWVQSIYLYFDNGTVRCHNGEIPQINAYNLTGGWEYYTFFKDGFFLVDDAPAIRFLGKWYIWYQDNWEIQERLVEVGNLLKLDYLTANMDVKHFKDGYFDPKKHKMNGKILMMNVPTAVAELP